MSAIRTGCKLLIKKRYYKGSFKNAKYAGDSDMWVTVLRHSYGDKKGQHTFTCRVDSIERNESELTHKVGQEFRIKGRNLYPEVIKHTQGEDSKNDEEYFFESY